MPKLVILGTANAISDECHENTHMIVVGNQRIVLIDCVDSTILRLNRIGVDFNLVSDLILTHFHPDHVSGVPQFLMKMWLMGRNLPLNIYGLHHTLDRIEDLMDFYGWFGWPKFFPVIFNRLPLGDIIPALDCAEFRILAAPVKHLIPTIGLRIEFLKSKKVVAFSSDTESCPQVIRLAEGADILIHEASGLIPGHSSAEQAGKTAAQAKAKKLVLIHFPTGKFAKDDLLTKAQNEFEGPVTLAEDFASMDFD